MGGNGGAEVSSGPEGGWSHDGLLGYSPQQPVSFVPTPDGYYQITHVMSWAGKRMTVTYYKHRTGIFVGTLASFLDHLADSFQNHLFKIVTVGPIATVEHTLRDTGVTDGGLTLITTTAHTGGNDNTGGTPVPLQVAGVVSMRSGLVGRSFRGRIFMPAFNESSADKTTGRWLDSDVGTIDTAIDDWMSDSNSSVADITGTSDFAVGSRVHNGVPQNPRLMTQISTMALNPVPCTQRRRSIAHHGRLR